MYHPFFPSSPSPSFSFCLREVAWKLRLAEPSLYLLVDESDEGLVLLGQLLIQDPVVLLADMVSALLEIKKMGSRN